MKPKAIDIKQKCTKKTKEKLSKKKIKKWLIYFYCAVMI